MPDTLRLADGSYMRRFDLHSILQYLYNMQSVEVLGFSNIGKSALLRLLSQSDVWIQELGQVGSGFLPVYIDCNRMLHMNAQGFYELVLRCLQECSGSLAALPELAQAYETLVAPTSEFQVPLSFNRGLSAALRYDDRKLVLLFDEFDEPFSHIDSRVFLNLRALKDRDGQKLAYVTATGRSLIELREEEHCTEFCELFRQRTWRLAPLTHTDADRLIRRYIEAYEAPFTTPDFDFIYSWAGGHPTMLEGVCRILEAAVAADGQDGSDSAGRWALHQSVGRQLRTADDLMFECAKIWEGCTPSEQTELLGLFRAEHQSDPAARESLLRNHLVFNIEGRPQPFSRLFGEFIQRRALHSASTSAPLWVDVDSGEVLVGGRPVETLTNLEYRLMLLLYQNADKIVDKYQIVTHVWGESYIDEVDDARIEKLISRLRQKIEPDPGAPRFLTTVRGRGYRLLVQPG